ncbi:hypothetical protein H8959_014389 [Pygathrix nigripes]
MRSLAPNSGAALARACATGGRSQGSPGTTLTRPSLFPFPVPPTSAGTQLCVSLRADVRCVPLSGSRGDPAQCCQRPGGEAEAAFCVLRSGLDFLLRWAPSRTFCGAGGGERRCGRGRAAAGGQLAGCPRRCLSALLSAPAASSLRVWPRAPGSRLLFLAEVEFVAFPSASPARSLPIQLKLPFWGVT